MSKLDKHQQQQHTVFCLLICVHVCLLPCLFLSPFFLLLSLLLFLNSRKSTKLREERKCQWALQTDLQSTTSATPAVFSAFSAWLIGQTSCRVRLLVVQFIVCLLLKDCKKLLTFTVAAAAASAVCMFGGYTHYYQLSLLFGSSNQQSVNRGILSTIFLFLFAGPSLFDSLKF